MVDDKYVGLALAISSSFAIGSSFIITKKGLNQTSRSNAEFATDAAVSHAYLQNPVWWLGMSTMVIGEIANFAAYAFAPPILVTPLGALSVIIGAILASIFLKEELGHLGRIGCTLCLIGSLIIILHAPDTKDVKTVDEILQYAIQPGFLLYCFTVLVFSLVMVYYISPRYGKTTPIVYISICSLVGSVSVMAINGFGIALKLTFAGNNQLTHPSTYVFGIVVVVCILVQMNYFNKALAIFSTNVVNPMYYVGFSSAVIVASLILFQGFNTTDGMYTVSLLLGFIVTFLGVHLLNLSRIPEPPPLSPENPHHTALETGLLHPRLSISGRMSADGWPMSAGPYTPSHTHRGSFSNIHHPDQRHRSVSSYSGEEGLPLERLREEEEEEDADETTTLTRLNGVDWHSRAGVRHASPPPPSSSGDTQTPPRP